MPLSFLVATDQEMLIVDAETTPQIPVSADNLKPTHAYTIFAFLQNTDNVKHEVEVTAWHDTFGIGIREQALAIIQPERVVVPGQKGTTPGVATLHFSLVTPPSGRGRLALKVVPLGPSLVQNVRIVAAEKPAYERPTVEYSQNAIRAAAEQQRRLLAGFAEESRQGMALAMPKMVPYISELQPPRVYLAEADTRSFGAKDWVSKAL